MKRNQLHITVIGLIVVCAVFVTGPSSLLASGPIGTAGTGDQRNGIPVGLSPEDAQLWLQTNQTIANAGADPAMMNDPRFLGPVTLFEGIRALPPEQQGPSLHFILPLFDRFSRPKVNGSPTIPPSTDGRIPRGGGPKSFLYDDDITLSNPFENSDSPKVNSNEFILAQWSGFDELLRHEINSFKADWEEQERISKVLDQQWQDKINELIQGIQNHQAVVNGDESVVVLDAVDFTSQIQAIHRLLNPPERLHPWLKWLLYLHRVSPEMLQFYQAALEGRNRIYTLASKSDGRLKIRYQGRIMDFALFPFPEDAEGRYELVMVRGQNALISPNSSTPVVQAASGLPPQ